MNKMAYRLETDLPFEQVVDNIERLTPENNFRVLAVHDVQATLAEKGFERPPLKIIEVCNAGFAHQALSKDIGVALFIPCRFAVFTAKGKTVVTLARPTMISELLPDAGLEDLSADVETRLMTIMEQAVR